MATQTTEGSAKIYQFPARGRFAAKAQQAQREQWRQTDVRDAGVPRAAGIAIGSGWYHEAAIAEARRAGES